MAFVVDIVQSQKIKLLDESGTILADLLLYKRDGKYRLSIEAAKWIKIEKEKYGRKKESKKEVS